VGESDKNYGKKKIFFLKNKKDVFLIVLACIGVHGTASTAIYRHSSVSVGLTSASAPNPLTAQ